MQEPEEPEDGTEVAEVVRVGLDVLLTLLCIYVMWGYVRDRPEIESARAKATAWWHKVATEGKRIKKMENETVFEAIQVVEATGAGDGGT